MKSEKVISLINNLVIRRVNSKISILLLMIVIASIGSPLYFSADELLTSEGMLNTETGETSPIVVGGGNDTTEEERLKMSYEHDKQRYDSSVITHSLNTLSQNDLASVGVIPTSHSADFVINDGTMCVGSALKMMQVYYRYNHLSSAERTPEVTEVYNYVMANGTGYWEEDTGVAIVEHYNPLMNKASENEVYWNAVILLMASGDEMAMWEINGVFQYNGVNYTLDNNHILWSNSLTYNNSVTYDWVASSMYGSIWTPTGPHPDYTTGDSYISAVTQPSSSPVTTQTYVSSEVTNNNSITPVVSSNNKVNTDSSNKENKAKYEAQVNEDKTRREKEALLNDKTHKFSNDEVLTTAGKNHFMAMMIWALVISVVYFIGSKLLYLRNN